MVALLVMVAALADTMVTSSPGDGGSASGHNAW